MTGTTGNHDTGTTTTPTGGLNDCWVSPSDQAGQIDNILDRLKKVEDLVALLTGANLSVGQLSELSEQVGWVTVDYLGQPGWIQTEYGTLIPPPGFSILGSGFTLSDGNVYTAVVMDENGVLQYGFGGTDPDGNFVPVSGAAVAGGSYIRVTKATHTMVLGDATLSWDATAKQVGADISNSTNRITVNTAGWYIMTANMDAGVTARTDTFGFALTLRDSGGSTIDTVTDLKRMTTTGVTGLGFSVAMTREMEAGSYIEFQPFLSAAASDTFEAVLSVTKLAHISS